MGFNDVLFLDPSIRDWVVFPLAILIVLVGILRHYLMQAITSSKTMSKAEYRHRQTLHRSTRLRANGHLLRPEAVLMRKSYFLNKETGVLREEVPPPPNPMMNPAASMDMMKGQAAFMIQNMFMMNFVSYLFSGFIMMKLPFELTWGFKSMLQRGVEIPSLHVSFVSSISWYFIVNFGLKGIYQLLLGEDVDVMSSSSSGSGNSLATAGGAAFDAKSAYKTERGILKLYNSKLIEVK